MEAFHTALISAFFGDMHLLLLLHTIGSIDASKVEDDRIGI